MAKLEDALKKLNKSKAGGVTYNNVVGGRSIQRSFLSTGSPYIDSLTGGGFVRGAYNCICAKGGGGKTSIALRACALATQNKEIAIFVDGEGTIDDSYIDRMGVDRDYFVHQRIRGLEDMLDYAEIMSTVDNVAVIVLDSISIFVPDAVGAKTAGEDTMGVAARRFSSRMPIIEGNCIDNNIAIIGLTSYRTDLSVRMGDNRRLPAGVWQIQMMNTFLDLTRKGFIFGSGAKPIGHELDVRIKKSKTGAYDPTQPYRLNFFYDGGFDKYEQYVELFIESGLVVKGGAWFKFFDHNGEEQGLQGKAALFEYIKSNDEAFNHLVEEFEKIESSSVRGVDEDDLDNGEVEVKDV